MAGVDSDHLLRGYGWGRLGAAALLLALGSSVPADWTPVINRPVLAVAVVLLAATSAWILLRRGATTARDRWLVCLLDAVVVTAVVAATGGGLSMFSFLYVLLVVAACLLLSRRGGLTIAGLCSALYTGLVFLRAVVPTLAADTAAETTALEIMTMFLNAGTLLVVGIVAGGLAERVHAVRRELDAERRALGDLRVFKDLVFESVETGLIATDRSDRITAFNRAAEAMTGVSADEAVGRPWSALFGDTPSLRVVERQLDAGRPGTDRVETSRRSS